MGYVFFHSGAGASSYRDTVAKAISNTVDIHRLLKMYTPECTKVFSFVFPKIGWKHCVTQIECKFEATPPCFKVVEKPLALSAVRQQVVNVIRSSLLLFINQAKLRSHLSHSFFVRLSAVELGKLVKASGTYLHSNDHFSVCRYYSTGSTSFGIRRFSMY